MKNKIIKAIFVYFVSALVAFGYFIALQYYGEKVEISTLLFDVFLPFTALGTLFINYKNRIEIKNFSLSKVDNLKKLNDDLKKMKMGNLVSVDVSIDNKININISSKFRYDGELLISILNILIIIMSFAVVVLSGEVASISLLLFATSALAIISDVILNLESRKSIQFEMHQINSFRLDDMQKNINNIFEHHMTDRIKYHAIQEFNNQIYYVIGYSNPQRLVRMMSSIFELVLITIVFKLMIKNGNPYILFIFPALIGYFSLTYGEDGKVYSKSVDTLCVEIRPHKDEYEIKKEFDEIEIFISDDMKIDILYRTKSKIKAMIAYIKLRK